MITQMKIAVASPAPSLSDQTEKLATRLNLPMADSEEQYDLLLKYSDKGLELVKPNDPLLTGSVRVDFTSGRQEFRRKQQKKELLVRAAGCKKNTSLSIIDATGGLGRDSFLLAASGCRVQIFEQQPIIAALLTDGLERAREHPETSGLVEHIRLRVGNAVTALQEMKQCGRQVDTVYLDPMFPHRRKSALVKKELQILQLLTPVPSDKASEELLQAAFAVAGKRVVVKRSLKAPFLTDITPSYSLTGKTVRFDVYQCLV